ncbi:WG repeat-containing protein [Ferruginibacter lapsinanis]|uniref:WG repeat-containing protein n=1 Tax=Ferruginibacter lapsinanis TaxID=563172 RepID=UPI001E644EEC|nr:WG repeat-containing protein [Ferruginibacter lapsinanis]UEG48965.1 WG repeat-containing protein [Ferruginibacter lapsinanis]
MKKIGLFVTTVLGLLLSVQSQDLIAFKNAKGLWGFKDKTGKVIVEPKYLYKPSSFVEGRSIISKTYSLKGVVDEKGKEITPPIYYSITNFKHGFATVTKEFVDSVKLKQGKLVRTTVRGVIDRNGKEVVPVIYKELFGDLSNGWFAMATDTLNKKFYYNTEGKIFAVPEGMFIYNYRVDGKKFVVGKNGKVGLIDKNFKELLPFDYSLISPTQNNLLIVGQNNLVGLMDDRTLKWIVQPKYKNISFFQQGYGVFTDEQGLLGAINTKGVVTTKPQFNTIYRIDKTNSALAMYMYKGSDQSGLVDLATGKIITPAKYLMLPYDYDNGIIVFRKDNKKGMIDSTGKELFYAAYDDFSSGFSYNRAWVMKQNKFGFIDNTGKLVIPIQYDIVGGFVEGLAKVRVNGKYGYIDPNGKLVIPQIYLDAQNFESGMAWVKDETNRTYYIDKEGKEVK